MRQSRAERRADLNRERRHPCRRVAAVGHKLAGRDAGAPGVAAGSKDRWANRKPSNLPLVNLNVCVLFLAACLWTGCQPAPKQIEARTFRVMTYNIHHAEGLDGKVDLLR